MPYRVDQISVEEARGSPEAGRDPRQFLPRFGFHGFTNSSDCPDYLDGQCRFDPYRTSGDSYTQPPKERERYWF